MKKAAAAASRRREAGQRGDNPATATRAGKGSNQAREYFEGWQRERAILPTTSGASSATSRCCSSDHERRVIKKYLTVVDDLERALKARPTEGPAAAWSNGIELIYRKLQNILEAEGVKRIPAESEEFNPSRHEAISMKTAPITKAGRLSKLFSKDTPWATGSAPGTGASSSLGFCRKIFFAWRQALWQKSLVSILERPTRSPR
jgi:hypothetical protein